MIRSIIICLLLMTVPVFAEHETNHYFIVDSTTAEFEGATAIWTDDPILSSGIPDALKQQEAGVVWVEVTSEQYAAGFEAYGSAAAEAARAAAVADIESLWTEIERKAHVMQFLMDNRIRVLESRGTNTWAQYKSEVDAL